MDRCSSLFFAFMGAGINQIQPLKTGGGFEVWRMQKKLDDFIEEVRKKIPPVNDNALGNYHIGHPVTKFAQNEIDEEYFSNVSWGLLIPCSMELGKNVVMSIVDLFSTRFLYPLFVVDDMSIEKMKTKRELWMSLVTQTQQEVFKNEYFSRFYIFLEPMATYVNLEESKRKSWDKEDWRLVAAWHTFCELRDYDDGKNIIGWQREASEITVILESLLTAEDATQNEVGYRLRKRAATLVGDFFPEIEKNIKKLYDKRCSFVHGSFFAEAAKQAKKSEDGFPLPDMAEFDFLESQIEVARFVLVACLILSEATRANKFDGYTKYMDVLEDSIINVDMRRRVNELVNPVLSLMPKIQPIQGRTMVRGEDKK
jgi:hypothetical protein